MLLEPATELQLEGPLSPAEIPVAEWTALWQRCSDASPFHSPAWIHAWWAHFGGLHPWILAFRHAEQLVGIVPLFLWPEEKRVLLMGTGITDSLDLLAENRWKSAVAAATLQWLDQCRSEWDICDLQQLPEHSPLRTVPIPETWEGSTEHQDIVPVLTLPSRQDEMPRVSEIGYLHRRLAKEGPIDFVTATSDNLSILLSELNALHGARWSLREESGVLADERVRDFHSDAAHGLLRLGALRLFALKVAGETVAIYYGFQHAGRAVYYLGGFAPGWKRFSVGTMIVGHAIAQAIQDGAREFDFGRGAEPYKFRWKAEKRLTYRREFFS